MIGLARYLCLQNYKAEDIMILTTHKDQVYEFMKVFLVEDNKYNSKKSFFIKLYFDY